MSFFGSFFGNDQKKDLASGAQQAGIYLNNGYKAALTNDQTQFQQGLKVLNTGYKRANTNLDRGYNSGVSNLNQGFDAAGNALSNGYNQTRSDIGAASAQGRSDISGNYGNAISSVYNGALAGGESLNQGIQNFQPYLQQGTRANALLGGALGLNEGQAASTGQTAGGGAGGVPPPSLSQQQIQQELDQLGPGGNFGNLTPQQGERVRELNQGLMLAKATGHSNILDGPAWQQQQAAAQAGGQQRAQGQSNLPSRQTAQDIYFSDPAFQHIADLNNKALFNKYNAQGLGDSGASRQAAIDSSYQNYGGWLDRLSGQAQQGMQAGGQIANLQSQKASLSANAGQQAAGLYGQQGNALAQSGQYYNGASNAAGQYYTGAQANNAVNRGSSLADLGTGYGSARANNALNFSQKGTNLRQDFANSYGGYQTGLGNALAQNITSAQNGIANARGIGPANVLGTIGAIGSFFGGKKTA